jgi:pimeloyl-ACP methyl ester carboxylesterase
MRRIFLCFFLLLCSGLRARADNLVNFTRTSSMSVADANARMKKLMRGFAPAPATKPIDLYRVRYTSKNEKNANVVVSGLVALPRGGAPKGLVVFNHGTTGDRAMSPSRWTTKMKIGEAQWGILVFATGGYAVAMPDYLGLGDNEGPHPYPLSDLNALSAIDIISPARSVAGKSGVAIPQKLFMTGYSEGGAVAMWATKLLEARKVPITASAPISGPYDLSGTTRKSIAAPPKTTIQFAAQLYLLAYTVRYFHQMRGVPLSNYFAPGMAKLVEGLFENGDSDETMIRRLVINAYLMGANNSLDKVTTPRFRKALSDFDTTDPVISELVKSDCYDWAPRTKMLLVSLANDEVVDPINTKITLDSMRKRGVTAATLRQVVVEDENLNHLTAPFRLLALTRKFFDGGFTGVGAK